MDDNQAGRALILLVSRSIFPIRSDLFLLLLVFPLRPLHPFCHFQNCHQPFFLIPTSPGFNDSWLMLWVSCATWSRWKRIFTASWPSSIMNSFHNPDLLFSQHIKLVDKGVYQALGGDQPLYPSSLALAKAVSASVFFPRDLNTSLLFIHASASLGSSSMALS